MSKPTINVKITGTPHSGKTSLAVLFSEFLAQRGYTNVRVTNGEGDLAHVRAAIHASETARFQDTAIHIDDLNEPLDPKPLPLTMSPQDVWALLRQHFEPKTFSITVQQPGDVVPEGEWFTLRETDTHVTVVLASASFRCVERSIQELALHYKLV